jgi:hypothetical protein
MKLMAKMAAVASFSVRRSRSLLSDCIIAMFMCANYAVVCIFGLCWVIALLCFVLLWVDVNAVEERRFTCGPGLVHC